MPRLAGTGGAFSTSTKPTLAQVEGYVNQISAMVNAILATAGFSIPVRQADILLALAFFVEEEVASICEGINGSGRFGPTAKPSGGKGRYALLMDDVVAFINGQADGFELMGADRPNLASSMIGFRDTDNAGAATYPLFTRQSFSGGDTFFDEDPQ